jgi:hypothetical protein
VSDHTQQKILQIRDKPEIVFPMKIFSLFSGYLVLLCLAPFPTHAKFSKMQTFEERCVGDSDDSVKTTIRVAHVGNSFQYYGDLPRLLERMLQESFDTVVQGSCLRPSSTLRSVLDKGNGMESRFTTPVALLPDGTYDLGYPTVQAMLNVTDSSIKEGESYWDYVIVNDRSLHPADLETRGQSLQKLKEDYVPLLESVGMPTVVFSMTWAYREPTRGSETFGTFDDLTELLLEGYEEYEDVVDDSIVAPTGLAFNTFETSTTTRWET